MMYTLRLVDFIPHIPRFELYKKKLRWNTNKEHAHDKEDKICHAI